MEVREEGQELVGTVLTEGRAASGGRAEVFAPGSVSWDSRGIGIRTAHGASVESRAHPTRQSDGRLTIATRATQAISEAVAAGKRYMSVEFVALRERTTKAGVREVLEAFLRDAALTASPEYDSTAAEVREREREREQRRRVWL